MDTLVCHVSSRGDYFDDRKEDDEDAVSLFSDSECDIPDVAFAQDASFDSVHVGSEDCVPLDMEDVMKAALESRSLTPILKEELRCKIQLKRLSLGEDEMTADFTTKSFSMSLDEIVKRNRKQEQNRLSAHRSREKQKANELGVLKRLVNLQQQNTWLASQVHGLQYARSLARQWLTQHATCSHGHVSRSSLETPTGVHQQPPN